MEDNKSVKEALENATEEIKKAIQLSLEDIKGDSKKEQEYIDLWAKYVTTIGGYFTSEADRTGNQQIIKNIKKSVMKNTNILNILPIPKLWGN